MLATFNLCNKLIDIGKGDIVSYNGKLYKSTIDGNVWAPDAYPAGWTEYTE